MMGWMKAERMAERTAVEMGWIDNWLDGCDEG